MGIEGLIIFVVLIAFAYIWHILYEYSKLQRRIIVLEESLHEARFCINLNDEEPKEDFEYHRRSLYTSVRFALRGETLGYVFAVKEDRFDYRDEYMCMSKKDLEKRLSLRRN